ncbi:hypothetical protein ACFQ3R_00625 [Mesonia ostreae]|uniref:Uncharacterized protein n=1 Tax=Mesonia ostreae TaxID=861110 RepID=A0ABU2KJE6_9FLAO|nr:hypothetical protein [Mesonia ostreae]MDT0294804.1 hypothetical protein [Mesonia ostreae]
MENGDKLTEDEITIFQQYFSLLQIDDEKNDPILINELYKREILALENIDIQENKLVEFMDFHHDLMVLTSYGARVDPTGGNISECGHRDCLDCCMYWKLKAIEQSNWIDQLAFVLDAATETIQMLLSCSWDCLMTD